MIVAIEPSTTRGLWELTCTQHGAISSQTAREHCESRAFLHRDETGCQEALAVVERHLGDWEVVAGGRVAKRYRARTHAITYAEHLQQALPEHDEVDELVEFIFGSPKLPTLTDLAKHFKVTTNRAGALLMQAKDRGLITADSLKRQLVVEPSTRGRRK